MDVPSNSLSPQKPSAQVWPVKQTDPNIQEAIRYAYESNLVADHRLNSFSITHLFDPLVQSTIPVVDDGYGFTDDSRLPEVEIPAPLPWERLSITDGALRLIRESRCALKNDQLEKFTQEASVISNAYIKSLKIELPILRTDNEWDMKELNRENASRIWDLEEAMRAHGLPLHPQDLEIGEGMDVSLNVYARLSNLMREVEMEKLAVTKDDFQYLVSQLRHPITHEDRMRALIESIQNKKNPAMEKLTPPISPKLPQHDQPLVVEAEPLSERGDCSSTLSENFHSIEEALLGEHQDMWSENTSPSTELLQNGLPAFAPEEPFIWDYIPKSLEDLKLEVPLMFDPDPGLPGPSGPDMFKDFADGTLEPDPGFDKTFMLNFSDDNLEEQLQAVAEKAQRLAEQEKLLAVDAIARVPVPVMDFSIQEPEWTRLRPNAAAIFKWLQGGFEDFFKPPTWPSNRVVESKLIWSPIRAGALSAVHCENMDVGVPLLQDFLKSPQEIEILGSIDLVKQRPKPAVFENPLRDDEIEIPRKENPSTNLVDIVRKRSKNLESTQPLKKLCTSMKLSPLQITKNVAPALLLGNSPGAPAKLLANFLEFHAPTKQFVTQSKYFAPTNTNTPLKTPFENTRPGREAHDFREERTDNASPQGVMKQSEAPFPPLKLPDFPLTAFVSINVSRRIIRTVECLVPNLTLIERNYDAHNTSIWRQNSVARSEIVPDLANDADFGISPTTGLLIMSMIRIRQKPRTGESRSLAECRIEKASLRYERLVVMIGGEGGCDDSLHDLPFCDLSAIQELQGFSSGLDCNVVVQYVGGGDKTIAAWVASCLCRYSMDTQDLFTDSSEMETLWELFLRRAGCNAFAARAVMTQLKPPNLAPGGAEAPSVVQYGLGAFVVMTRAERMRRYGQLVGQRVLERVNTAIDEIWNR